MVSEYLVERFPVLEPLQRFAESGRAKGTLGMITVAVGFLKLFARAPAQPVIVGDFLPAAAGMLLGAMLMIDSYRERQRLPADEVGDDAEGDIGGDDVGEELIERTAGEENSGLLQIDEALKPYRKILGFGGIAVGIIHFLLAGTLFL